MVSRFGLENANCMADSGDVAVLSKRLAVGAGETEFAVREEEGRLSSGAA